MNCNNCGKALDDDAKVCDRCGAILENTAKLSEKQAKNMFSENINKITEFLDDMTESSSNADMIKTLLLAKGKPLKGFILEDELRDLLSDVFSEDEVGVLLPTLFNEVDPLGNKVFRYQKTLEPSELHQEDGGLQLKSFMRDIIETVKEDILMKSLRGGGGSLKSLASQELDDMAIIKDILSSIDQDNNGKITRAEFFDYLCDFFDPEVSDDYTNKLFEDYDKDKTGFISTDLGGAILNEIVAKDQFSVDDVLTTMAQTDADNEALAPKTKGKEKGKSKDKTKDKSKTKEAEKPEPVAPTISADSQPEKKPANNKVTEKVREAIDLVSTKYLTSEETPNEPNVPLFEDDSQNVDIQEVDTPTEDEPMSDVEVSTQAPIEQLEEALEELLDTHKTISSNVDDEFGKISRSNIENIFEDIDEDIEKGKDSGTSKGQTLEEVKAEVIEEVRKDLGVEEVEEEVKSEEPSGLSMLERLKNELNSIEDTPDEDFFEPEAFVEELQEPETLPNISEEVEDSKEDLVEDSGFDELENSFKELNIHEEEDDLPNIASRVEEEFEKMNFFKGFDDLDDDKEEVKKAPSFFEDVKPETEKVDLSEEEDFDLDSLLTSVQGDSEEDFTSNLLGSDEETNEPIEDVLNPFKEETFDEPEEFTDVLKEEAFDEPEEFTDVLKEETFDEPEDFVDPFKEETFDEPEEFTDPFKEETFDEPEEFTDPFKEETFDEPEDFADPFKEETFDEPEDFEDPFKEETFEETENFTEDFAEEFFGESEIGSEKSKEVEDFGFDDFEEAPKSKKPKNDFDDVSSKTNTEDMAVEEDDYDEVSDDDIEEFLSGGSFFDQEELEDIYTDSLKLDLDQPKSGKAPKKNKQDQLNEELENFQDQIDKLGAVDDDELNKFLTGEKEFFDDEELEFTLSKVKKDMVAQQVAERNSKNAIDKREKTLGLFKKLLIDVRLEVINMVLLLAIIISVGSTLFIFYEPRQNLYYANYSEKALIEYERALRKEMYIVIGSQDIVSDVLYEYMAGEIDYDGVYYALEYHKNLTSHASEFFLNRVYREASDYTFALHEFSIESARISEKAMDAIKNNEQSALPGIIEEYDNLSIKDYHITTKRNEFLEGLGISTEVDYFDDFYTKD